MSEIIALLNKHSPEQFIEKLTNETIIQSEKDVIENFRDFELTDSAINTLLYYMFFMDTKATWVKLSNMAAFFHEHHIETAEEAMETIDQLQQYEQQLDK